MARKQEGGFSRFIDGLGELLAMALLIIMLLVYTNDMCIKNTGGWGFLGAKVGEIFVVVMQVGVIIITGLKALEFALKRNAFMALIFIGVIVAVFVFMGLGGTFDNLVALFSNGGETGAAALVKAF